MDENINKRIGRDMGIVMGLTISLLLSFVGTFTSGQFTVPGFIISFLASFAVSLVLGFFIPMRKIADNVCRKASAENGILKKKLLEALVSDLIYTPIMTLLMVTLAYKNATSHGAQLNYVPMFLRSLVISLLAAYGFIYLVTPLCMKLVFKKNGLDKK